MVCQCGRVISEKEPQLLQVWQPRSPCERLPEGNVENYQESRFNLKGGMMKKGDQSSQKLVAM